MTPWATRLQFTHLIEHGRLHEAIALGERGHAEFGRRDPSYILGVLDCLARTRDVQAAQRRGAAELAKPGITIEIEAAVASRVAWLYLNPEPVGAWQWHVPSWAAGEAIRLAELAHRRDREMPINGPFRLRQVLAPIAAVRALQGRLDEAERHAKAVSRDVGRDPGFAYHQAAMLAVLGMVAAGRGKVDTAQGFLDRARTVHPRCDVIPALELSMPIAECGGLERYWELNPERLG